MTVGGGRFRVCLQALRARKASHPVWLVLFTALLARFLYVVSTVDPEYDGYDRFLKGILLLKDGDVRHHWVWLPLFQYIDAVLYWLTGSYLSVRFFSAVCGFVSLIILYRLALRLTGSPSAALVSLTITAFNPLLFLYDTTGMTESFFTMLTLAGIYLLVAGRFLTSSIPFSLACLVRYEGWFLTFFIYLVSALQKRLSFKAFIAVLVLPSLSIGLWLQLNYIRYGDPLHFLRALDLYCEVFRRDMEIYAPYMSADEKLYNALRRELSPVWYIIVYFVVLNPLIFVMAFRRVFRSLMRKDRLRFLAVVSLFYLALITSLMVLGKSEGWPRHSIPGIPLFVLLASHDVTGLRSKVLTASKFTAFSLMVSLLLLSLITIFNVKYTQPLIEVSLWLRENPTDGRILCTRSPIIILSGLPAEKFIFLWRRDISHEAFNIFLERNGVTYVVSHLGYFSELCRNFTAVYSSRIYTIYRVNSPTEMGD